jgi:hypothetical protein
MRGLVGADRGGTRATLGDALVGARIDLLLQDAVEDLLIERGVLSRHRRLLEGA